MPEIKPKIEDLQKGILYCPSCKTKLLLNAYNALEVAACSSCRAPLFIPMKIKHYWLYHPLGGGGMGSVYRALSEEEVGEFAVKILPKTKKEDQDLIKTLMMEGEVGTILGKSPHIIEVVDYGCESDEYYMASRFVEGTRLDVFISAATRLSERQALDIITQVLDAEIHIKNCGYLFRDIKPENIIVIEETASVKVLDFGLCISLEQAANPNPEDHLEGSPYYMPPERIVAAPEGEYSEIYSLGMLLFHMLSGTTYFSKADVKDLLTKHVRLMKERSVKQRLPKCSQGMVDLIDKMIQSDPNKRYHTLSEVVEIVERLSKEAAGYPLSSNSEKSQQLKIVLQRKEKHPPLLIKFAVIITLATLSALSWHYYNKMEQEEKVIKLIAETAADLNIPVDIKPPSLTKNEIERLIAEKIADQIRIQTAKLTPFNEEFEKIEISEAQSIDINTLPQHYDSLEDIKKRIKQERLKAIERKLQEHIMVFETEKREKQVAESLNLKLPIQKPLKTVSKIKQEAIADAVKLSEQKFPLQLLAKVNMEILKRYKCYKVGDKIMLPSRYGEKIEGVYKGINGRKIIIGTHEVLLSDLPQHISIKFNKSLASKQAQDEIQKAKSEYLLKKQQYKKSLYNEILEKQYKDNGYIKSENGWVPALSLFNQKMKQQKEQFEQDKLEMEEKIISAAKNNFGEEKYYINAGYRKINEKWITEKEIIDQLLAAKRKKFQEQRQAQIEILKNEIRNDVENQIYIENGYIFHDGKWCSAKKLLDETVEQRKKNY